MKNIFLLPLLFVALSACATVEGLQEPPTTDQQSLADLIQDLGEPTSAPLIVAVPAFMDQTGQRAMTDRNVAELSTAIPQGLSTILVQELMRAGQGEFYRVVEREYVGSLLDERRIATATLAETGTDAVRPLLLPGILLVGGAVSYDRKVGQSLAGLGYDSINLRHDIVADEVGVILRAVSVQTGEILHTVHASKTVLSQRDSINGLRILNNNVAAIEFGQVVNEPVSLAVRLAIASAVVEMTKFGIENQWWSM
ncbi:hypothetical protein B9057_02605 [Aestuarium zhoushanense]|nr:hypothetical protein B9057_02605 [Aestuarium zhoushanense]